MTRPKKLKKVCFNPRVTYFKPRGVAMCNLSVVILTHDEAEALRLKNIRHLSQHACAKQMKTSQSTFQRIITRAYEKVSDAVISGKAIQIECSSDCGC